MNNRECECGGKFEIVKGDFPFTIDYLQCNLCDATKVLEEDLDD